MCHLRWFWCELYTHFHAIPSEVFSIVNHGIRQFDGMENNACRTAVSLSPTDIVTSKYWLYGVDKQNLFSSSAKFWIQLPFYHRDTMFGRLFKNRLRSTKRKKDLQNGEKEKGRKEKMKGEKNAVTENWLTAIMQLFSRGYWQFKAKQKKVLKSLLKC